MLELGLLDYLKQFLYPSIKVSLFNFSFSSQTDRSLGRGSDDARTTLS
eukprot:COSAG05_NODE_14_length_36349_cov_27.641655_28_plen_48_part_00